MLADDIQYLEKSMSSFKEKYDDLAKWIPQDDNQENKRYIIAFNIAPIIQVANEIGNQINDLKNFEFHAAIAIINTIAHYKHFYSSRVKGKTTLIIYLHSLQAYSTYAPILEKIKSIVEFFPGIIYVDSISKSENMYPHIVYGIIQMLKNKYAMNKLTTIVHVYSMHAIDTQLLFASESNENRMIKMLPFKTQLHTKNTIMSRIFVNNKEFYSRSNYKTELEALVVPIGLYMNTLVKGPSPLLNMKGKRKEERMQLLSEFIKNNVGKLDTELFDAFKNTLIDEADKVMYDKYIQEHDYHMNKQVIELVKPLLSAWASKIKDYAAIKENEKVRLLQQHDLRLNWLLY